MLLVGGGVAAAYTTFETREDHQIDLENTREGITNLFQYKDDLDQQRYEDLRRMLNTLYDLHLGPYAYVEPADKINDNQE